MSRVISLWVPAWVAYLVGAAALLAVAGGIEIRGGSLVLALTCSLVIPLATGLVISLIDRTRSRLVLGATRRHSVRRIAGQPQPWGTALLQTYLQPFFPVLLLSAGWTQVFVLYSRTLNDVSLPAFAGASATGADVLLVLALLVWSCLTACFGSLRAAVACSVGIAVTADFWRAWDYTTSGWLVIGLVLVIGLDLIIAAIRRGLTRRRRRSVVDDRDQ